MRSGLNYRNQLAGLPGPEPKEALALPRATSTSKSFLPLRVAYFPGALVILMNTWSCGGGGGLFDFFYPFGMAMDSTSTEGSVKPLPCYDLLALLMMFET